MITHYSADWIKAAQEEHPGHLIVEVVTPGTTCLLAIPDTPANRSKPIPTMPGMSVDLLDSNTITTTRREGTHEGPDATAFKR